MFAASSVFAEDCSRIDVRDQMNPELKAYFHTSVDQGPQGWCYAHTASDMMSQALGIPVSTTYTGSYYANKVHPVMRWARGLVYETEVPVAGFINLAIEDLQEWGMLCKASVLTSHGVLPIQTREGKGTGKLSLFFTFLDQYRHNKCTGPCPSYIDGLIAAYLPAFQVDEVKKFLKETRDEDLASVTFRLFNEMCQKDPIIIRPNQFKLKIVDKSSATSRPIPGIERPSMTEALDQALAKGKVVGLEYNASYVDSNLDFMGSWHTSAIIGREQVGGACYYRIRNTWSKNFNYAPGILWGDRDGSYLVDRITFRNMAVRVLWIE